MYQINNQQMSKEFFQVWRHAGIHLNKQVQGGTPAWLRAHPNPPFLDHLSFRLGNQLFFVRVEDVDGKIQGPGILDGLVNLAKEANGYACLLPMKKQAIGNGWESEREGWGLIDAESKEPINPVNLVTNENVEMTDWECQDTAVQTVKEFLEKEGYELMSWQSSLKVDPAVWFVGDSKGPEYVVVRTVKYPENEAKRPKNWEEIGWQCAKMSDIGHFASVALASENQPFKQTDEPAEILWRGHGMIIRFTGLE
tara:strand:+ start:7747 stop:8505 length:759 start_codon:yes stop_codon:yes gene_type:complete